MGKLCAGLGEVFLDVLLPLGRDLPALFFALWVSDQAVFLEIVADYSDGLSCQLHSARNVILKSSLWKFVVQIVQDFCLVLLNDEYI